MSYTLIASSASSLAVQFGSDADIARELGGEDDGFDPDSVHLVLNDQGNQHALIVQGDREQLRELARRIAAGCEDEANFQQDEL